LDHREVMKTEPSRMFPLKFAANPKAFNCLINTAKSSKPIRERINAQCSAQSFAKPNQVFSSPHKRVVLKLWYSRSL